MAKNLRSNDPESDIRARLIQECKKQYSACLETAAALYEWLKRLRLYRKTFISLPLILTAVGTWYVLRDPTTHWLQWFSASCILLAGLIPAIYKKINFEGDLNKICEVAAKLTNLRDRFRYAADIHSLKPIEEFETVFNSAIEELETIRQVSLIIPDKFHEKAKEKIKRGVYNFDIDN